MPGILCHIFFAEELYRQLKAYSLDESDFLSGNLIPDLAIDKELSHYRTSASFNGFFVPDLDKAKKDLFYPNKPVLLGMFSHLYLDHYFIENFLIKEFRWDIKKMKVLNPYTKHTWDIPTFFSDLGLYGAYSEVGRFMINNRLVLEETLMSIPEHLPETGLSVFDKRREKSWKSALQCFLSRKKAETGVFSYDMLLSFIKSTAEQFIREEFPKQ